jgi:hypothetical protein
MLRKFLLGCHLAARIFVGKVAAAVGARLRLWRATESDGNALQLPYIPNGRKGYITATSCSNMYTSKDIRFLHILSSIVAGTKIAPSRSLLMNAVLPHGNKQHLILSTDIVQLNGKLRVGGITGNNAGRWGTGV